MSSHAARPACSLSMSKPLLFLLVSVHEISLLAVALDNVTTRNLVPEYAIVNFAHQCAKAQMDFLLLMFEGEPRVYQTTSCLLPPLGY